jgi:hypothetical protein
MRTEDVLAVYIHRILQRFLLNTGIQSVTMHHSLQPFSRQSAESMHRNAGMLSKLIPGVDRGTRKGYPSFAMFSSPPIGLHRP